MSFTMHGSTHDSPTITFRICQFILPSWRFTIPPVVCCFVPTGHTVFFCFIGFFILILGWHWNYSFFMIGILWTVVRQLSFESSSNQLIQLSEYFKLVLSYMLPNNHLDLDHFSICVFVVEIKYIYRNFRFENIFLQYLNRYVGLQRYTGVPEAVEFTKVALWSYTLTTPGVSNWWHNSPEQILMSQYSHRLLLSCV